jgi:hypothetical protein
VEKQFPEIYKVLNYLMQNDNKDKNQKDRNLIGYKKDK